MRIEFHKMEGAGNDYVYVDCIRQSFSQQVAARVAARWSDRHFGIGSDGLILMLPSAAADVGMAMWNADGSVGAMCGNGVRCLGKLAYDLGHVTSLRIQVETAVGIRSVQLELQDDEVVNSAVDIGTIHADGASEISVGGQTVRFHRGDAGNPHAVVLLEQDPDRYPVVEVGAAMQRHPEFPDGVNVEFVHVRPDGSLRQRTFERGSGETLACGSGAAVAAFIVMRLGLVETSRVHVHLRGGCLAAELRGSSLVISGPARTVYSGTIEVPSD